MTEPSQTAFITGGASGIGRAVAEMLVFKGFRVFIADCDLSGAQSLSSTLNQKYKSDLIHCAETDVSSWPSQLTAFQKAVDTFKRIDYVFPIAGIAERQWIPKPSENSTGFQEPDLGVLDINLKGVLYSVALAVQQFRRQEIDSYGFRGKIGVVASVCGFYTIPTLPVYTAAKHGVVGLIRSYGQYLPKSAITLNAICPNVVRTSISTSQFYDRVESEGLLVPMEGILAAFENMLGENGESGVIWECGPKGGFVRRARVQEMEEGRGGYLDGESRRSCELIYERALALHE
ncbi:NAD(P)-binding protein [Zopfia rhizophila CBS 207.26]|uniref:NAD(P)-binding protein n=1 Tax=Zopfia rhizophila CBS 207.26 TaxID=1314779 RepID=A0A6A6ELE3_9PEZI|nr:NAD(P)-binding protein [Zopfia rhizophila CBS 207.26]